MNRPTMAELRASTRKRKRLRLARAELIAHLSMTAERWASEITDQEPHLIAFDQWPADDPLRVLCTVYRLTPRDVAALLLGLSVDLEQRAVRNGYDESWTS